VKQFNTLQRAIFGAGVLVSAVWAVANLRGIAGFVDAGSGGLGAVSVGISGDLVVYLLPVIINLLLIPWARKHGPTAVRWQWAHLLTTLAFLGLAVVSVVMMAGSLNAGGPASNTSALIMFTLAAVFFPVQVFFAAGFVALAVRREPPGE